MPANRHLNRTLCQVAASFGAGVGSELLALRLTPEPERSVALRAWLAAALRQLAGQRGLVGAHLLERDGSVARADTEEQSLRGRRDDSVDWAILLEGYDRDALARALERDLSRPALESEGAASVRPAAAYRLAHVMQRSDLP